MKQEDDRDICKYGSACYQKNPAHHQKFKHPEKKSEDKIESGTSKRQDTNESPIKEREPKRPKLEKDNELSLEDDPKVNIKKLFLVEMPKDFYSFYEFCQQLNRKQPKRALKSLGLELVGPFDVLENAKSFTQEKALCHYRYYYDPPEFLTVLTGDDKIGVHYGYFRDDPSQLPVFVASNKAKIDCKIHPEAPNLFGVLNNILKQSIEDANPFLKMQFQSILKRMTKWCKEQSIVLNSVSPEMRARRAAVVAKTFNVVGIVVPVDSKTQVGYRELPIDEVELKRILRTICDGESDDLKKAAFSELMGIITYANIACDESDFGTSLQLGLNMFSFGGEELHDLILQQLINAYSLLKRHQFATIIKVHLKNRTKTPVIT